MWICEYILCMRSGIMHWECSVNLKPLTLTPWELEGFNLILSTVIGASLSEPHLVTTAAALSIYL